MYNETRDLVNKAVISKRGESLKHIFLISLLTFSLLADAKVDEVVMLDVPVVKQGRSLSVWGPALYHL